MLVGSLVFIVFLFNRTVRFRAILSSLILFIDLFFYGFTSIRPNLEPIASIKTSSAIVDCLSKDKSLYRVMEVVTGPDDSRRFPILPSSRTTSAGFEITSPSAMYKLNNSNLLTYPTDLKTLGFFYSRLCSSVVERCSHEAEVGSSILPKAINIFIK